MSTAENSCKNEFKMSSLRRAATAHRFVKQNLSLPSIRMTSAEATNPKSTPCAPESTTTTVEMSIADEVRTTKCETIIPIKGTMRNEKRGTTRTRADGTTYNPDGAVVEVASVTFTRDLVTEWQVMLFL